MYAARIVVEQVETRRPFPLRLRITEIFARSQQPECIHNVLDLLLETTRETADISTRMTLPLLIQAGIEHFGFQGCCRHTLSIHGVETAHRVAKGHETLWQAEALIVTPPIGRK